MKSNCTLYIFFLFLIFSCSNLKNNKILIEKTYYDNGVLQSEVAKSSGKLNGQAKYYDNQSNLISIASYNNNVLHGMWIEYYKNGKTKHSVKYIYGLKDGSELWYYESGNIKSETVYDNGPILFETLRWDTDGNILYK